jgi:hypothetical protein
MVSIAVATLLIVCGGNESAGDNADIENTIRGYFTTFNGGDFTQCLTYFTGYEDEEDALAFLQFMRGMSGELQLREIKDIALVDQTATATVVFTIAGEPGTDRMQLRKADDRWKIVWTEERPPRPTRTQEPTQYPPIRIEGCLPSTIEVAPELQGAVKVEHCLWSDEDGQLWAACQILNTGAQAVALSFELYVYDAEGHELLFESLLGGSLAPGSCWGYCDGGGGTAPLTTNYRIVLSS